jgi:ABC-2 type transport system ATP-binding protein
MELVAQLRGAHKRYGKVEALRGVDLDVRAGRLIALLGPNGAGKTTALRLLSGLVRPDQGSAMLLGGDPREPSTRLGLGVTPQEAGFPETMKVGEIIDFVRAHFRDPWSRDEVLERFELTDVAGRQAGGLSGGQKRRLAVALAFAGRPQLAMLDEPTTGLDVDSRHALWRAVREEIAAGRTILLTTHYLEEAEALADEVVVLAEGQVRATGSVDEIKGQVQLTRVRAHMAALPDGLPDVVSQEHDGERATLFTTDADALVRHLVIEQVPFSRLEVTPVSLEEAFLLLTAEEQREAVR